MREERYVRGERPSARRDLNLGTNVDYILSPIEIVFINFASSGDNAVVIAPAARNLPCPWSRPISG
jgi:hypothetical protein